MKKHIPTILVICMFLCGLAMFLYPTVSNLWNEHLNAGLIQGYTEEKEIISDESYSEILEEAYIYNEYLNDEEMLEELGLQYEEVLNPSGNGVMGYLEIPKISVELVIYHSLDESVLQQGIGHMEGTALPVGGESTHSVLAGHSGLPSAKLLTNLDQLELGDRFYIHVADEVLTYWVDDISVVLPQEVDKLAVQSGKDQVTLVTCTPYGINTHRLLVRGSRVLDGKPVDGENLYLADEVTWIEPIYLVPVGLILLVLGYAAGILMQQLWRKYVWKRK